MLHNKKKLEFMDHKCNLLIQEKKNEINALTDVLEKLLPNLSAEEGAGYQEKMQALRDHWAALKQLLGKL